jgi:hypothetical protein
MSSSAFALMLELHADDADITAMLYAWIELSKAKGWPKTEEGWRRYLSRLKQEGNFPKTKSASDKSAKASKPLPESFVAWWTTQLESGDGLSARVAYNCERYRSAWILAADAPPL